MQQHFILSYAGASHAWAAWIDGQLALQGHRSSMHRWDPPAERPLLQAYEELTIGGQHVVLLLDDWYFLRGGRSAEEWTESMEEAVLPFLDRVTVVDVAGQELPPATAALRPVSLLNLDETEARRRLFTAMGLDTRDIKTLAADGSPPPHRCPNTPPAVWKVPPRNARFTGREKLLEELHERFNRATTGAARVALCGMPGVGKTQIADEYIHRFGNEYDIVWHVNAREPTPARKELAALSERLGHASGDQVGEQIRVVHEALRTGDPYRRWLLVFDGAEEPDALHRVIPEGKGHVLLTSRTTEWSGYGVDVMDLVPFDRTESVAFARRRARRLSEHQAEQLAAETEDLPLVLDQCAAWLDANPAAEVQEYLEMLRRGEINAEPGGNYPLAFHNAWALTFNRLYEDHPLSYELLCLFAFFAPETIPARMVRTARRDDLPPLLGNLRSDPSEWNAALGKLGKISALRVEYEKHSDRGAVHPVGNVRMHRIYQRFAQRHMSRQEYGRAMDSSTRVLAAADPRDPDDRTNWSRYDELIPHLEVSGALTSDNPEVHELVLNCIEYLRVRGEYTAGWQLCRDFVAHLRRRLEPTDRKLLEAEQQHVNMLRRLGRYSDAAEVGRQTLRWLRADGRARPVDVLRAQDVLAGSLMGLGHYEEAHRMLLEEASSAAREFGPGVGRTVFAHSNLGVAQTLLGRYEEALATHRKVLEERRRMFGDQHPQTLSYALRHAWLLRLTGQYSRAESVQTLNARLHAQLLGKHHEYTLHAEHNLALCLRRTGHAEWAEAMMRSVHKRTTRKLGAHHPETLMVQSDYAMLLRQHGDLNEARRLARVTAALYDAQFGSEHPYTIGTFGNLGLMDWLSTETPRALTVAEEAWQRMGTAVGEKHPWTLGCALNVMSARHLNGADGEAAELARETLPVVRRAVGETHPMTLNMRSALARSLHAVGDTRAAGEERKRLLEVATETYGAEHAVTAGLERRALPYWDFEPQPI